MKGKNHDLNQDLTSFAHAIKCVCHSIRSMFRVLGIYNFAVSLKKSEFSMMILFLFCFPGDPRNYDDYPETDFRKVPPVTDREQRLFDDF